MSAPPHYRVDSTAAPARFHAARVARRWFLLRLSWRGLPRLHTSQQAHSAYAGAVTRFYCLISAYGKPTEDSSAPRPASPAPPRVICGAADEVADGLSRPLSPRVVAGAQGRSENVFVVYIRDRNCWRCSVVRSLAQRPGGGCSGSCRVSHDHVTLVESVVSVYLVTPVNFLA